MVCAGGEYRDDRRALPPAGTGVLEKRRGGRPAADRCCFHRGGGDPVCLPCGRRPDGISVQQGGEKDAAGDDLRQAPAAWRVLQGAGEDLRGRSGGRGGRGSTRNLLWRVSAPVLLRHAHAADAVCGAVLCERACRGRAAGLRAADSHRNCGGADVGQKAAEPILGSVHRAGRHLP